MMEQNGARRLTSDGVVMLAMIFVFIRYASFRERIYFGIIFLLILH